MIERLPSGIARLDQMLEGGLLKYGINLIVGVPGSGKTILSQQFAFHNATADEPVLYLSTMSEPLDKILRYSESATFFDRAAVRDGRVVYEDLGHVMAEQTLVDVLAAIDRYIKQSAPGLIVIDSFRAFHQITRDTAEFRRFLHSLTRRLTASSVTSLWNAPYTREQALDAAEFAIADAIIALDIKQMAQREMRVMRILKLRGSNFRSGEHAYRIGEGGFEVFPRLADLSMGARYDISPKHTATGIAALDALLGNGGYWAGATTLVAGPSGIGKTLMGLHFLFRGAEVGEPGIIATFQENETQLERVVAGFGWSFDGSKVRVLSRSVVDLNIDEWVYNLLDLAEETGAKRIVVDSLGDLAGAAGDAVRFREWMFSLSQRCTRAGVSLMLLVEVADLFDLRRVSDEGISHVADNVVLLQYVQEGSDLLRALTVLKTRAMRHHPVVHRYEINQEGFVLGDAISLTR
ncbi:MAG TPA: ATPase domain-containing protein [Candidatus Dormibacteraeota bacterium]|nr:ATPase domain-containing protein [Candidatus Dormibacteraeota bacterium]